VDCKSTLHAEQWDELHLKIEALSIAWKNMPDSGPNLSTGDDKSEGEVEFVDFSLTIENAAKDISSLH